MPGGPTYWIDDKSAARRKLAELGEGATMLGYLMTLEQYNDIPTSADGAAPFAIPITRP